MTFDRYYRTLHAALTEIVRQHFDAPNPHVGMGKFAQAATAAYPRMPGDPCRPQAQSNRCDRRSIGPLHRAGRPRSPEFVAEAVQAWITAVGAKTAYIERGSPWENGYIESFNARLRDELLNGEIFYTLQEAQIVIESWRRH